MRLYFFGIYCYRNILFSLFSYDFVSRQSYDFGRCFGGNGEGHEEGQNRNQWPATGLRPHPLPRGPRLPQVHGRSGQLCLGQQEFDDFPVQASFCQAVPDESRRSGYARHIRRVAQHRQDRATLGGGKTKDTASAQEGMISISIYIYIYIFFFFFFEGLYFQESFIWKTSILKTRKIKSYIYK